MFGRRDPVPSVISLTVAAVVNVRLAVGGTLGHMGYLGEPNTRLNNTVYSLFFGLGMDDAFVLTLELMRHTMSHPELSLADRVSMAGGGC